MHIDRTLLEQQIAKWHANYEEKRNHNKRVSRSVAMLCAVISAITTVLIGASTSPLLTTTWGRVLALAAMVASAGVAVIAAWDGLFNHKKLWVLYTQHWIAMSELQMDLEHAKRATDSDDTVYEELYARFKAIRASLDAKWSAMKLEDFGLPQGAFTSPVSSSPPTSSGKGATP